MSRTGSPAAARKKVSGVLLWRRRAQIGNQRTHVAGRDGRVVAIAHGRRQLMAVLADAAADGALDLGVAPASQPVLHVRGDVLRSTAVSAEAAPIHPSASVATPVTISLRKVLSPPLRDACGTQFIEGAWGYPAGAQPLQKRLRLLRRRGKRSEERRVGKECRSRW